MSENELSSDIESSEEGDKKFNLDVSETESDNESGEDDDKKTKTSEERIRERVWKRYNDRQGKQLYIRFPHKLPQDEGDFQEKVKSLSPLIVEAHKPRQKHARFCLVDFNSKEDRDVAFNEIRAEAKKSPNCKIVVSLPRTENMEFVGELVDRKVASLENKRAKTRLKRASKQALNAKSFTSSIVILNLPKTASLAEVRKLFPNAVDIQIKTGKGKRNGSSIGTITLPSTMEARSAARQKLSLIGTKLIIRFDTHKVKKHHQNLKRALKRKSSKKTEGNSKE